MILKFKIIVFQNDFSPKIEVKINEMFSLLAVWTVTVKTSNFILIHQVSIEEFVFIKMRRKVGVIWLSLSFDSKILVKDLAFGRKLFLLVV